MNQTGIVTNRMYSVTIVQSAAKMAKTAQNRNFQLMPYVVDYTAAHTRYALPSSTHDCASFRRRHNCLAASGFSVELGQNRRLQVVNWARLCHVQVITDAKPVLATAGTPGKVVKMCRFRRISI